MFKIFLLGGNHGGIDISTYKWFSTTYFGDSFKFYVSFKKGVSFFSRHSNIRVLIKEGLPVFVDPLDHLEKAQN